MKKEPSSDRPTSANSTKNQQTNHTGDHQRISTLWRLCKANRYPILSALLLLVMLFHSLYGEWGGDFWEHSAVARELATHPFDPQHPLLMVNQEHPFFSPYLLLVGLFARLFSLDAITALMIAGLLNLLLLLLGLRLFVQYFFTARQDAVSFYALILILFLWPEGAWNWSGFFHFKIFGLVLPYPSTFALALTFLIFALYYRALQTFNRAGLLVAGLLTAVVLLTHPTTAVTTIIGIGAISLHYYKQQGIRAIIAGLLLLLGAALLALLWPYYPFFDLLRASDAEFHTTSYILYQRLFVIWPTLLLLPFALATLVSRMKNKRLDALTLMIAGSVVVYLGGLISGLYGFGRIISFIAILIQIAAAAWMALVEGDKQAGFWRYVPVAALIFVLLVSWNPANASVLKRTLKGAQGQRYSIADFAAMGQIIDQYDVVLADLESSWPMPTYGGKVIASQHPAHWVDDHEQRRQDLLLFFSGSVNAIDKLAIIDKYSVDYILVDRLKVERWEDYFVFGEQLFESERYVLLAVGER